VSALDLLGNGTSCIVLSSSLPSSGQAPLQYLDLMQGQKPNLLIQVENNLGTETRIHYTPSTKFYLDDAEAGNPWLTRLPFPVQCVDRIEITDRIAKNYFLSTYSYHHGYFDGVEREFYGFARVDRWDTEDFAAMSDASSQNIDAS
jgi:Insecticide toxin TcdB middle/N-terminal region